MEGESVQIEVVVRGCSVDEMTINQPPQLRRGCCHRHFASLCEGRVPPDVVIVECGGGENGHEEEEGEGGAQRETRPLWRDKPTSTEVITDSHRSFDVLPTSSLSTVNFLFTQHDQQATVSADMIDEDSHWLSPPSNTTQGRVIHPTLPRCPDATLGRRRHTPSSSRAVVGSPPHPPRPRLVVEMTGEQSADHLQHGRLFATPTPLFVSTHKSLPLSSTLVIPSQFVLPSSFSAFLSLSFSPSSR